MATHPNLDPELRAGLEQLPLPEYELTLDNIAERRAEFHAVIAATPLPETTVSIEDRQVPGPEGEPDIRLRIYRPAEPSGTALPALYWIHGGGMIVGTPEIDDAHLIAIVEQLGIVALSVEYRLAPEHPYPAPVEDCYAGLVWTAKNAAELGIDPSRLALGGASAGGGLAAATALLARDRGGPALVLQLLMCPMLDDRNITPSSHEFTDAVVWNRAANLLGWTALLGDRIGTDDVPPYAAPARATDLSGLPQAFVDVGELEVFRDECVDYVLRLVQAGVSTEFHLYPGAFHGFDMMMPNTEIAARAQAARVASLKRALLR